MARTLVSLLFGLAVMGAVLGVAIVMLVFLGQDWDDALFWVLAAVMIGAGLLVVTMRDIIRCGLAMIVCFGALAGIYVLIGAPLIGATQVIVYIGAISVLILFAIMLTQTKDAPARLVFQTQAGPAAILSVVLAVLIALAISATDWGAAAHRVRIATGTLSRVLFNDFVLPFEVVSVLLLAAVVGGRVPREARAGRPLMSDSLDAYLVLSGILFAIGSFGFLARRNAISMLMSIELMLNAVNLAIVAFGAFIPELGAQASVIALMVMAVAAGRGDRRAWPSSSPSIATRRRRSSTNTTRCASERLGKPDPGAGRPAARGVPGHGGHRATARTSRRTGSPSSRSSTVWFIARLARLRCPDRSAPLLEGAADTHGYAVHLFTWIPAGRFVVEVGFFVDHLTACLLIVVTTIGLLVHVYSIGYMSHDPGYWRFFAYLNLFMFSCCCWSSRTSGCVVFVAWELVGLSSYLLIGFWYRKRSAALGGQEGVHRQPRRRRRVRARDHGDLRRTRGDARTSATSIERADSRTARRRPDPDLVVALLVFAGAMGKSAQFPLHVWLPDAMEGPTPVSALIHAATMVNAGVYLVARANPLFAARAVRDGRRRRDRHLHRDPGGLDRDDPDRHQARPRVFDAEPARLHVRGARGRGVHRGDLPPHDPRLLQGPAVPRLGLGHPRRPRGAGHAPDGRPGEEDPDHLRDDAHRLARDRRASRRWPASSRKDEILGEAVQARLPAGSGRSASSSPA